MSKRKLGFIDHQRQHYANVVPIREELAEAEFMIGDYFADDVGGVDTRGEFKVTLQDHTRSYLDESKRLTPYVHLFQDGYGAFKEAARLGLMEIEDVASADEYSERLIAIGLRDRSDNPIGSERPDPRPGRTP